MSSFDVHVDFKDGLDDENYTGPGIFVRHISEAELASVSDSGEPHCIVKCDEDDAGSVFPTRCVQFVESALNPPPAPADVIVMSRYNELLGFHQKHAQQHEGTWVAEQFHQRAVEAVEAMRASLDRIALASSAEEAREIALSAISKVDAPV